MVFLLESANIILSQIHGYLHIFCLICADIIFFDFFFKYMFFVLWILKDRIAEDMIGNRLKERGNDMQQWAPGWDLNLGPLQ